MAGVVPISAFGAVVVAEYGAGRAVAVDDVRAEPDKVPAGSVPSYEAVGIRAHCSVPVVHSARLVSCIGAHSSTPRHWKLEEVELLRTVVERTWLTVEVLRKEQAVVREAQSTARILESIVDGFHAIDREWRFTYLNPQAERILARPHRELLGKNIWEVFPEAVNTVFEREYRRAMFECVAASFEEFYPPLNTWLDVRASPSEDGLSVFFQDVTERRRNEEALRQSEERYRLLVEGATVYAMILTDTEGLITSWNRGAERIMGWTEAEVLGRPVALAFTPEDRAEGIPERELRRASTDGRAVNLRWHMKKDWPRFYADGITEGLLGDEGNLRGFAIVMRDATGRKALEDERLRLVALPENSTDFIGMSDMADIPFYVNPTGLRLIGLADMEQATRTRGIQFFHEDDRDFILNDLLPRVLREGHVEAEMRLRHFGTGEAIWVNYTLFTIADAGENLLEIATVICTRRVLKVLSL